MEKERVKDIFFVLYILVVIVLAGVYFTAPERKEFFDFQEEWWRELWDLLAVAVK